MISPVAVPRPVAVRPVPAAAPAAPAAAAARPADELPPIVDFPDIGEGDEFTIAKGSKVGVLPVKGTATLLELTDDTASFTVKARALFVKADVDIEVERLDEDTVMLRSRGTGIPDFEGRGRIVENRTNYLEVESLDYDLDNTIIKYDGEGRVEIHSEAPGLGAIKFLLDKETEASSTADAAAGAAAIAAA